MSVFVTDTYTDTGGTTLTSHTGETGASWTETTGFTGGEAVISAGGTLRSNSASEMVAIASGTPGSADYPVLADFVSVTSTQRAGLVARWTDSGTSAGYMLRFREFQGWQLFRYVSGTPTQIGSTVGPTSMPAGTYRLRLECSGIGATVTVTCKLQRNSDSFWLNSSGSFVSGDSTFLTYSDTDANRIVTTGKAGVTFLGAASDSTGYHLDNFQAGESGGDVTAPTLSSPTASETSDTTADLGVDTDEGNGTLYWVVTQSGTAPSTAQVKAGQDHTGSAADDSGSQVVSGTGTQAVSGGATGLVAETTYYAHFMHEDAATNQSTVATSSSFTTEATPADLTAGTASFVSSGPGGIAVEATDATGGTTPYTYQWERNEDGGSYSDVSGATSLSLSDSTATTGGVLYGYRLKYTDDAAATVTSTAVTAQVYSGGALGSGGFNPFSSPLIRGV